MNHLVIRAQSQTISSWIKYEPLNERFYSPLFPWYINSWLWTSERTQLWTKVAVSSRRHQQPAAMATHTCTPLAKHCTALITPPWFLNSMDSFRPIYISTLDGAILPSILMYGLYCFIHFLCCIWPDKCHHHQGGDGGEELRRSEMLLGRQSVTHW